MLQRAVFRLAAGQIALTGVVVGGAAWLGDAGDAYSALAGGGIGIVCGLYQAMRMFRVDASADPEGFLRGVYISEAIKIVLTVALIVVAIRTLNVNFLPFMLGYIATYVVYWVALGAGYPWQRDVTAKIEE
jgi:F0F1-type ATP synthase assembly protein I